jgi:hypothetical protein
MTVRVDDDMIQCPFDMTVEQFDAALEQFALSMDDLDCGEREQPDDHERWIRSIAWRQDCPW